MDALSQKLMEEAAACLKDGDDDEALRIYERILELDEINIDARRSQIRLLIDTERVEEAISALKKLLEVRPRNANAHWSLARQLHKSGLDEQAVESYTKAIDLKPERAVYYFQRAQSLKNLGLNSDAVSDLQAAMDLEPENTQYQNEFLRLIDADKALAFCERMLEHDENNVDARKKQVTILIDKERVKEAVSSLKKLLEILPDDPTVHWSLARQLHKSGLDEQAVNSYARAIQIDPSRSQYYFQRAQSLKLTDHSSDALADLRTAIELEPENAQYQDAFIEYAREQRDWSTIIDVARALITKGVAHSSTRICLVDALISCDLRDEALEENHSLFESSSACSGGVSLFEAGLNYVKLDQFRRANECFKLALLRDPRPAAHGYLNWLQICSLHLNEEERLNEDLSELLDDNPQTFINASSFSEEFTPFLAIGERQAPANPILLNTMPKSGSVYIWRELSCQLGFPMARISKTNWPVDHVIPSWVEAFSHSRTIAQGHFNPHESNIRHLLNNGLRKMIFHIRDPRQATLSWTHHVRSYLERNLRNQFWPPLPNSYEEWSFERQLSWNIEHHLPGLCQWITQWDELFDENNFEVLFTSYEDFKSDELQYFKNLLSFISPNAIDQELQPSKSFRGRLHFREGKTNEWEEVYSDQQKRQALEFIPDEFLDRFSWSA